MSSSAVRTIAFALFSTLMLAVAPGRAAAQPPEVQQAQAVVELFTSQGCNSCPAGDDVLAELAETPAVLALAWHIDFWDYIGWKDTFGDEKHTKRWMAYAKSLGLRAAYTPQAVVNGRVDIIGHHREKLLRALDERVGTQEGMIVPIKARITGDMLKVEVSDVAQAQGATLWMVYFDRRREVRILRGENRGRTLRYANIVRAKEMIGTIMDQSLQTEFALTDIKQRGHEGCALILQKKTTEGLPGPIIGAAFIPDLELARK